MKKNTIFIPLALFFLLGCQANPSQQSSVSTKPVNQALIVPSDTSSFFYADGIAATEPEAQNSALSKIANRISVSVESKSQTSLNVKGRGENETVDKAYQNQINTKTREIDFTNVNIINQKRMNNQIQVVVRVDRKALINNYQNKIEKTQYELNQDFSLYQAASPFQQLKSNKALLGKLADLNAYLYIMGVLDPQKKNDDAKTLSRKIVSDIQRRKQDVTFKIVHDNNSQALAKMIAENLTAKGYTINSNAKDSEAIQILLKTAYEPYKFKTTSAQYANLIMVNRTTKLAVIDEISSNKKVISSRLMQTRGISSTTQEDAIQDRKPYQMLLEDKDIIDFLANAN